MYGDNRVFSNISWEKVNSQMRRTALRQYLEISIASLIKNRSSPSATRTADYS